MRTSTAYFAGLGTVIVAIAAGLGGGLLVANIVSPNEPKSGTEMTRLERRMAQPIQVAAAPATSAPVTSTPVTSAPSEPVPYLAAAAAPKPVAAAAPAQVQTESATVPAAQPALREIAAAPQEAFANARDVDIKRAAATEKRRAERHQRWADSKRRDRQPRVNELEAVEQAVRGDTEPRQAFAAEPVRLELPRIRLFD